ncbi:LysR family transcriptional regulator [bacterium]|nr:MAG: LysR family transcriptional regulator [bacterium]
MELRHIKYFLAVAEEGNFTRAAQKIGIGQPPLSQQIRDLEREIGVPLFRRLPHGAELTEAGQAFLPEARTLIEQSRQAIRAAQRSGRGEVGQLRVGYTSSAAFHPIVPQSIRAFRKNSPEVELTLTEADTTKLLELLQCHEVDVAFVRPGHKAPTGVRLYNLDNEAMFAVLPSGHPLAESQSIQLAQLAEEILLLFPRSAGTSFFDDIIAACQHVGFEPILGQQVPQISSVGNLVAAELGVSIVPETIAQVQVAGVKYIPITGQSPRARLDLATRPNETSIVVHNFIAPLIRTSKHDM